MEWLENLVQWTWLENPWRAAMFALCLNLGILIPLRMIQWRYRADLRGSRTHGLFYFWMVSLGNTLIIPAAFWASTKAFAGAPREPGNLLVSIPLGFAAFVIFIMISDRRDWSWEPGIWRLAGLWNAVVLGIFLQYFTHFFTAFQGPDPFWFRMTWTILIPPLAICFLLDRLVEAHKAGTPAEVMFSIIQGFRAGRDSVRR